MRTETIHYLTQEELKELLKVIKAASKRDYAIFLTAYFYGLRASEVGELHTEDVDFSRMRIRIQRVKGSISGEYALRPDVAKALKSYLRTRRDSSPYLFPSRRNHPISRRTLDWLMKRYAARAGIPKTKRHFHVLKHSIATHMLEAGFEIMEVKDWLGHKNIQNTLVYAELTGKRREDIGRRMVSRLRIV